MEWFYNLSRKARVFIAVIAWLPLFIAANVFGKGGNNDDMSGGEAFVALATLAIGIYFTVFAIKATRREKAEQRETAAAEQLRIDSAQQQPAAAKTQTSNHDGDFIKLNYNDTRAYSDTPAFSAKLIQNSDDDTQSNIESCKVGDEVSLELDYETNLYLCDVDGLDIGFIPDKIGEQLQGSYKIIITDIFENENGKYSVKIDIFPLVKTSGVRFPVHTKIKGVTFGERQGYLSKCVVGDVLTIKHAPTAEYPDTISIINDRTGDMLGNIGSDFAATLLEKYGADCAFIGEVTEVTGGDNGRNYGCNIIINGTKS